MAARDNVGSGMSVCVVSRRFLYDPSQDSAWDLYEVGKHSAYLYYLAEILNKDFSKYNYRDAESLRA